MSRAASFSILWTVAASLALATAVPAQDYFVDAERGSDANPGTLAEPWQTVHFALTGPHALGPNSTIHLLGTQGVAYGLDSGEVFPWRLSDGISLVAEPTSGRPDHIVDGGGTAPVLVEFDALRSATGVVSGLSFQNCVRAIAMAPAAGMQHSATITNNKFHQISREAIQVLAGGGASTAPVIDSNTVSECAYEPGTYSIYCELQSASSAASSGSGTVQNNSVVDDPLLALGTGGIYVKGSGSGVSGGESSLGGGSLFRIAGNLVSGCQGDGIRVENLAVATLAGNEVRNNAGHGIVLAGLSPQVRVIGNRVYGNQAGGLRDESCTGTLCCNNLVFDNFGPGIELTALSTSQTPLYAGNTVVHNRGAGFRSALNASTPAYLGNSILWQNNLGGADITGLADGQYANCVIGRGGVPGSGNIAADPKLDAEYHLTANSPCIDAGDAEWVSWATDREGDPRVLNGDSSWGPQVDIGADEWSATHLSVSGDFTPGSTVGVRLDAPAGSHYVLYAAAAAGVDPLTTFQSGLLDPMYGTVLLDPAQLLGNGPVATGTVGAAASAQLHYPLRSSLLPGGWHVALQAFVSAGGSQAQATNAATFVTAPS